MKGTLSLAALAFVLALVLTSCGGGSSGGSYGGGAGGGGGSSHGTTGRVIKTIAIKESEYKLSPSSVTLSKPGTYAFKAVNSGSITHALEIEGKGVEEETKDLDAGQSAELKVNLKPGKYEIYCPVDGHKEQGMEGTVTVKGGSPSGGGGY